MNVLLVALLCHCWCRVWSLCLSLTLNNAMVSVGVRVAPSSLVHNNNVVVVGGGVGVVLDLTVSVFLQCRCWTELVACYSVSVGMNGWRRRKLRVGQHVGQLLMGGAGVIFLPLPVPLPVSGFPVNTPRTH